MESDRDKEFGVDSQKELFSKSVKAGKRTYFFDIKSTRGNDFFITITESKRSGEASFIKHKIFLYKEDFEKFADGLTEAIAEARKLFDKHNS